MFFRCNAITHLLQCMCIYIYIYSYIHMCVCVYKVNITFLCTEKPKSLWLTLSHYSPYWTHNRLHPRYACIAVQKGVTNLDCPNHMRMPIFVTPRYYPFHMFNGYESTISLYPHFFDHWWAWTFVYWLFLNWHFNSFLILSLSF